MRVLVIGLGSMGKRRVRCLQALGLKEIYGFDRRADRAQEAAELYGVTTFTDLAEAEKTARPEALIISVSPDQHIHYINYAIAKQVHFFVEASVVDAGLQAAIRKLKGKRIVAAPSATMMFHPAIKLIARIVKSGELGKISNITLHSGQYLPDWHTYEKVSDYYVSNPPTGGGREIVPFELTWFTMIFGFPKRVAGNFRRTIRIKGAERIDDTYNCLFDYGDHLASVTVDVVSRYATRRFLINGDKKQLYWSWDENAVKVFDPARNAWEERRYEMAEAQAGYNANIGENMYIDEIRNYLDAIAGRAKYINTMAADHAVLKLLYKLERSDRSGRFVKV